MQRLSGCKAHQSLNCEFDYSGGEGFPLSRSLCAVSGYPICGGTPQRPGTTGGQGVCGMMSGTDGAHYCARLRRARRVRGFNEKGPAGTLNRRHCPCAGDESRQAPPFRLHQSYKKFRLLSGCSLLLLRVRWPLGRCWHEQVAVVDAGASALLCRPRRDGVSGAPG